MDDFAVNMCFFNSILLGRVGRFLNMAWLPKSTTASPVPPRRTSIDP